ncbi:MAG TPA: hypothetical protein VIY69_17380 [Candidatus Acidoferrales bacterium]
MTVRWCFLPFQRAFSNDCYQQSTACAGVGRSSESERADARRNSLKEERVTIGIETIRRVESIRADLCFLGMCSLHADVGIAVGNPEEAYVKQAMIGVSAEVVGLISLGKMGTSLPYVVGPASRLKGLITDASDEDALNPYRSQGIEVTST